MNFSDLSEIPNIVCKKMRDAVIHHSGYDVHVVNLLTGDGILFNQGKQDVKGRFLFKDQREFHHEFFNLP